MSESTKISLDLALALKSKGFVRPSALFWYTDIEEVGEWDEDGKEYSLPAYSLEELDKELPVSILWKGVEFFKYSHSEYIEASGDEIHKTFYGKSEHDKQPFVITSSVKSPAESRGFMALELLSKQLLF